MYSVKNIPKGIESLREEHNSGYEIRDVFKLLSDMQTELNALEECWKLKTWNKEFTRPEPYKKFTPRPAKGDGYNVADVKELVQRLDDKIVQMRKKLDVQRDQKNWNQEWQTGWGNKDPE